MHAQSGAKVQHPARSDLCAAARAAGPLELSLDADAPPRARGLRVPASALLIALSVGIATLAILCMSVLSSARAYVGGESQWSKAQKAATLALVRYAQSRANADWQNYRRAIAIPLGDRRAREALERPSPDPAAVREGFVAGANHPDDVAGMSRLFRWFGSVPFMAEAIDIWTRADVELQRLIAGAAERRGAIMRAADDERVQALVAEVLAIDGRLTPLEARFSETLGEASRTVFQLSAGAMIAGSVALTALALLLRQREARRHAEAAQALRDSEARLRRALTGSSDGFWEWDMKRGRADHSPRFEALLGHPPGGLGNDVATLQALIHDDDREVAREALRAHLAEGRPYDVELRMRRRDGEWRWMRSRAQLARGDDGSELRLAGSISDVTERRQAVDALRRREELFRSLWETTSDAVLIVDLAHQIRFANPAAHEMFGHPPDSLAGTPLARLQPPTLREGHREAVARFLRDGKRRLDWRATEIAGLHARGHVFPIEICFGALDLDGEPGFVGFMRDITRRKEAEHALRDAHDRLEQRVQERTRELTEANQRLREVDRLKSEFLATMSHELRTPLNSVLGFTSILLQGLPGPLNDEQRRQLEFVHGSGRHLLALINDVLDLSRIESGRMELGTEDFDLAELAREACAQLQPSADRKGLRIAHELPPALPMRGDRRRHLQIVLNLLSNAVKFTDAGEVSVSAWHDGTLVRLDVADTGIGIAPEDLPTLFTPFRQIDGSLGRSRDGSGLGLYLCRRLLDLIGGDIRIHSEPGVGTRVALSLPPEPTPAAPGPPT